MKRRYNFILPVLLMMTIAIVAHAFADGDSSAEKNYQKIIETSSTTDPMGIYAIDEEKGLYEMMYVIFQIDTVKRTSTVVGYKSDIKPWVLVPTINVGLETYYYDEIADSAFYNCKQLVGIRLQETYKAITIGKDAFAGCDNLKSITVTGSIMPILNDQSLPEDLSVYAYSNVLEQMKQDPNWSKFNLLFLVDDKI